MFPDPKYAGYSENCVEGEGKSRKEKKKEREMRHDFAMLVLRVREHLVKKECFFWALPESGQFVQNFFIHKTSFRSKAA